MGECGGDVGGYGSMWDDVGACGMVWERCERVWKCVGTMWEGTRAMWERAHMPSHIDLTPHYIA